MAGDSLPICYIPGMARQVCAPQGCQWTVVGVNEKHKSASLWAEIVQFLSDPDRPGQWSVGFDMENMDGILLCYQISDPGVAFEFRMRFG